MQVKQISFNYSINNVFFQVNNRIEFTCLFYFVFKRKLNVLKSFNKNNNKCDVINCFF